jgi:hypothetical protein
MTSTPTARVTAELQELATPDERNLLTKVGRVRPTIRSPGRGALQIVFALLAPPRRRA